MTESDHHAATRQVYDFSAGLYVEHVGTTVSPDFEAPLDVGVLEVFGQWVASVDGPVLDAGCGPGRVTRFLADRGLDARGVDLSSAMVDEARAAHPALTFDVGSLTELPAAYRSLGGVAYWYSIIATPPEELPLVWIELDRVLAADGHALVAFQAGDGDVDRRPDAYGSAETLTLYRHSVEVVGDSLAAAAFDVRATVRRKPELVHETSDQAFLLIARS